MMMDQIYNTLEDRMCDLQNLMYQPPDLERAKEMINVLEDAVDCLRADLDEYMKSEQ